MISFVRPTERHQDPPGLGRDAIATRMFPELRPEQSILGPQEHRRSVRDQRLILLGDHAQVLIQEHIARKRTLWYIIQADQTLDPWPHRLLVVQIELISVEDQHSRTFFL
jgi:hypothetical protein